MSSRSVFGRFLICASFIFLVRGPFAVSAQGRGNKDTPDKVSGRWQPPWIRKLGIANSQGVIVFVHGVVGDDRTTWSNGGSYWPELLTRDKTFDGQDVYVYGYPSPKLGKSLSVDEIAENLRLMLSTDGVLAYKEITFVSHSMGGLVTRAFLVKYQSQVVPKVRLLYFFATPTTGSPYAILASVVSKNPQFGQMYPTNNPDSYLGPLQSNWLAAHFGLRSYCAYETQPVFGQVMIVEKDSATHLCTERLDPIDANHITIVKPADQNSIPYRALKAAFIETAVPKPAKRMSERIIPRTEPAASSSSTTVPAHQAAGATKATKILHPSDRAPDGQPNRGTTTGPVTVQPGAVASFGQQGGQTAGTIYNNAPPPRAIAPDALRARLSTFEGVMTGVIWNIWNDGSTEAGRVADQILAATQGTSWRLGGHNTKMADPDFFSGGSLIIEVNESQISLADRAQEGAGFLHEQLKALGVESLVKPSLQALPENFRICLPG